MIHEPASYTANRIDRMVGRVSLSLPPMFKAELDAAIDRGLARMPGKSRKELKDLVSTQVALTLRASDFSTVLDREFARQEEANLVAQEVAKIHRLDMLKRRYSAEVARFQGIIFDRSASLKTIREAQAVFFRSLELVDEFDAAPLKAWADRISEKRKKLRGTV